ncbi:hypothetical protein Hdeb2414_s0002g00066331 [Helianthus debilis subsp. tardiflorus]
MILGFVTMTAVIHRRPIVENPCPVVEDRRPAVKVMMNLVSLKPTRAIGRDNGYTIVTKRMNYEKGPSHQPVKIWLMCDCGIHHKQTTTVRCSGSRITGCEFQLTRI